MKPGLIETIKADLYRYRGSTSWSAFLSAYLHDPGFRFTYYMRKVTFYGRHKRSWGIFAYLYNRILWHHYRFRYGFDISPATEIGPGFYLGHFSGVIISPYARLGSNVNIAQGVTIGAESRGQRKGAPTIADRVWIGTNAVVVGKIDVGAEALIAPGAFVNFDVPPKAIVLGNPGKIVSYSGSAGYVNRTLDRSGESEEPSALPGSDTSIV